MWIVWVLLILFALWVIDKILMLIGIRDNIRDFIDIFEILALLWKLIVFVFTVLKELITGLMKIFFG